MSNEDSEGSMVKRSSEEMAYAFYDVAFEGAQVRAVSGAVSAGLLDGLRGQRPRSVVVLVSDGIAESAARLAIELRTPLEYPVVVARRLPRYVGPLDVVVILTEREDDPQLASDLQTCLGRGCTTVFAGLNEGPLAEDAAEQALVVPHLPTAEGPSPLRAVAAVVAVLDSLQGDPLLVAQTLSDWADEVDRELESASPERDEVVNPARELANISGRLVHIGRGPVGDAIARLVADLWASKGQVSAALNADDWALAARNYRQMSADIFHDPLIDGGEELLPLKLIVWDPGMDPEAEPSLDAFVQSVPWTDFSHGAALPFRLVARAWAATAFL
ncbi:hypothetical protein [Corynebacterium vitaeruminis]|uniref:hypothetical protein n=1 Tax=Corynebacterium vitaeruminis TaxID=38305 RepID=UPI0012DEA65A|nr:hypothetical protein [Corynebacterium vitaeruminis]